MAQNLTRKILAAHLARKSDMNPGDEIFLKVDQTLTHDINAVMTYLAFISNPDISLDISNGLEGLGYEIVDGEIKGFDRATRLANGTSGDPSDNSFMYSNHPSENVEQAKK